MMRVRLANFRVKKTREVMDKTDLALLVVDADGRRPILLRSSGMKI